MVKLEKLLKERGGVKVAYNGIKDDIAYYGISASLREELLSLGDEFISLTEQIDKERLKVVD